MEAVVGKAWVKAKSGGDGEDLQDWTDEGEDRFFISQSYDAQSKTFSPLYKAAVDAVNRTLSRSPSTSLLHIIITIMTDMDILVIIVIHIILSRSPATTLPAIKPLKCLDIFAGCGGLSDGLHQVQ